MFSVLPDPDPLVRGTDPAPAPDPSLVPLMVERTEIMLDKIEFQHKIIAKN
jgi:hypothetical protein